MNAFILIITTGMLISTASMAQVKNAKTESVKVNGNCGMCESTIEKAGTKKNLYTTDWNEETKTASITYDSKKTDLDIVLKNIALSGYDNVKYLAPDEVYNKLHECCKYDREKKQIAKTNSDTRAEAVISTGHAGHHPVDMANELQQTSQLKAITDNYFALKDALVKTDGNIASAKAAAMLTAIEAVEMEKLKMDEHEVWMKVVKSLTADAKRIKESKKAEDQRQHFMTLSNSMYALIKVAKPAETIYYQLCPMANNGKGANWLSKESAIKNPYYGAQMLSCGNTVETIKQ